MRRNLGVIKKWVFFSLFVRQWPTKDFGTFINHFQAFVPYGITKNLYDAIALGFGPKNHTLIKDTLVNRGIHRFYPYVYPLPVGIANLIQPVETVHKGFAHPSLLEGADTKDILKILKFKMWAEYMVKTNRTISDILKAEIKIFEKHGYTKRKAFQVSQCHYTHP